MSADVSADIESLCNKCGDVWHVVVAKVGDKIVKVQCKQCGGYHRYRPPGGKSTSTSTSTSTSAMRSRRTSAARDVPVVRIDKPAVDPDLSKPTRTYSYSESYAPGERVEHPKFGMGVVEITSEPGKMQVFFAEGRRVLALAKPKSSLERPQPFRHDKD